VISARFSGKGDFGKGEVLPGFRGMAYLLYEPQGGRRRVSDGALLIGDAAGLSFPQSGEGILPAIESALLAADTILAANGDYRADNLEPYAARLANRFGNTGMQIPLRRYYQIPCVFSGPGLSPTPGLPAISCWTAGFSIPAGKRSFHDFSRAARGAG